MRLTIFLACILCSHLLAAQQSQQVTGRVEDVVTRAALNGASVLLIRDSSSVGTTSDASGIFSFQNVFPGRYTVKVSFTGYESVQQELLVISARKAELTIQLREYQNVLDEVEVVSSRAQSYDPGEHPITNEKALRLPANFFDPVRVITSYPGVITANDQNNTIVIRGNSPSGLLWKINGLDVVNPNHLANAGTFSDKPAGYGGGVNIISSQLMQQTDFYAGSLPARYGNALSGVIDMKLRNGDTTDYHYTAQASLIGLDVAAEGPLGSKKRTSFLANYRYSTVGLLSQLGAKFGDEDISFQDLTFSLSSSLSKGRSLSWFGFAGASKNSFEHKDEDDWEVEKDQYDIEYRSKNFGTGLVFSQALRSANLSAGVSVSGSQQSRDQLASPQIASGEPDIIYVDRFDFDKLLISGFGRMNARLNNYIIETGVQVNYMSDDVRQVNQTGLSPKVSGNGKVEGALLQPYAQWRVLIDDRWSAYTAVRYVYFTYNETGAVEPRVGVEFAATSNSSFKLSYNLVSQLQATTTYVADNKNLELTKAHHLDLAYTYVSEKGFRFSSNAYYQKLFDVPVEKTASAYSILNSIEVYPSAGLISKGTGSNYGLEVLAEKSFFDKSYFIVGGSYYKSLYEGSDHIERSTRFDGSYTINATYGREWTKMKKESQRSFGVSGRALFLGGLREMRIVPDQLSPGTVYSDNVAVFENKLKDYFRFDLRLNWRKNKKNYTRTIAIDIQNLLNTQNEAYHYYDHVKRGINTQYQLGTIPVLVYRIDF
ncbi:MAG: TonB-dependent receptor [Cyclobacteriaceae bacterium]